MAHMLSTLENAKFSTWLRSADQDAWHQVAIGWNWDNGTSELKWIVEQPDCDIATALHIFWLSEPTHNLRQLDVYSELYRSSVYIDTETIGLQITILRRWVRGDFKRQELHFAGYDLGLLDSEARCCVVPNEVLRDMAEPRDGREVEGEAYPEGIPDHVRVDPAEDWSLK